MKTARNFTFRMLMILFAIPVLAGKNPDRIPRMDFDTFESLLHKDNDTLYIVNFWATWCKPCVKELPDFEKIRTEYNGQKVSVLLVSLDFPNKHEELLIPFVDKNNLQSEVIHLIDVDANKWIDKVSSSWSGAIPATLIYKGEFRKFHEGQMSYEELKTIVESEK
ncbi:MAG: redoxin domain-containing protein [Bacteroidales bacterium]|nr:redoxin domain-containing protein [Bacteroidales bacterium]